ncbi:alpha/beta hydrolase [Planomonospora sp. ID67723]|uniref:alpha/beta hydrolase family protein n=1 Tax=Planomonospora sp. ID67723 TaxID=2738134 RepID=UPI0018C3C176|nr:alpha/beta hydrolase [Planomonospora sp. ID67723]MBG0830210.1 alpha/beta hydrolase [Planomonospora sp. ID67723]
MPSDSASAGEPRRLRHLGEFSALAGIAAAQRGLFPPPGPGLRERARDLLGVLELTAADVRTERTWKAGELSGEEVSWDVGFGPRTRAYVLRPREAGDAVLPGVLALHCHAGMKWAGKEKIADGPEGHSAEVARLRTALYDGRAWAGELAARGFTVLVPDVLGWGSRRIPLADMPENVRGNPEPGVGEADRYDAAAARHEHVLAKYCTVLGTSYAGVVAGEDLAAAAYLRSRPDTGPVGCAGLSGGGLRAALLGAFDPGMAAVAVIAMVSSYRDLLDGYVASHTWMLYPPGLSRLCDLPDLVACAAPRPLLVWYGERDAILPADGMRRAHAMITAHYRRAPAGYTGVFADTGHCFGIPAQERVFGWLARHLRADGGVPWR